MRWILAAIFLSPMQHSIDPLPGSAMSLPIRLSHTVSQNILIVYRFFIVSPKSDAAITWRFTWRRTTIRNRFNAPYAIEATTPPLHSHRICKITRSKRHSMAIQRWPTGEYWRQHSTKFAFLKRYYIHSRSPRSTGSASSISSLHKRKYSPHIDVQHHQNSNHSDYAKRVASNGSNSSILYCIHCTKSDFDTLDQLHLHIQQMHATLLREVRFYKPFCIHIFVI